MKHSGDYEKNNATAAAIILGAIDFYGGAGSALVAWALLWQQRHGGHQQATEASVGHVHRGQQLALAFERTEAASGAGIATWVGYLRYLQSLQQNRARQHIFHAVKITNPSATAPGGR